MFRNSIYCEVAIIMRTQNLRRKTARTWLALAIFAAFSCCGAWAAGRDASCAPSFPLEAGVANGWQGADVGYSIPLKDGRDLWIFGDTLYGKKRVVHGEIPVMVHSSLGISTCKAGKWKVNYFLRRNAKGQPV